jgi:hypothetical protein
MKWNAFDFITPAIAKTKTRLFPFRFGEWFKLGIMNALEMRSFSFNFSGFNGGSSEPAGSSSNMTFEEVKTKARENISNYWGIGAFFISILFIFGAFLSYIGSVFNFIFLDSIVNKKAQFTFSKNNSKGVSLFLFRVFFSVVSFIVLAGLVTPYLYNFMKGNAIIASVGIAYIIFSILFAILFFILMWFILLFVDDLVIPYMYSKETTAFFSWKKIWGFVKLNKTETLVYWAGRFVASMVIGIAAIIIIFGLVIIFAIVAVLIFLIGLLLFKLFGGLAILLILGAILAVILILTFILVLAMCILPFSVFIKYFQLLNFEKLTKIKILK